MKTLVRARTRTDRTHTSDSSAPPQADRTPPRGAWRAWAGVAAITASLFTFVTSELMPIGLLSPMSQGLGTSVGTTGLIVTLYGISAGLGVPFITAWTARVDRRVLLPTLLAVLTAGNLITALSPSFPLLLAARLVMGFANGVFWAIGVSMAMRLVPERQASRAAAMALSGISAATVVGIPLGTFLAGPIGWRGTFMVWSGLSAVACLLVTVLVPSLPSVGTISAADALRLPLRNRRVGALLLTVSLCVIGHFGAYTFVRPWLEQHVAASTGFVAALLVGYGLGGMVGNFVAGPIAARNPGAGFLIARVGIAVAVAVLALAGHTQVGAVAALVIWGISFGATSPCQVTLVLRAAPDTFEAAMSMNALSYNTSIALGALIGGFVVDHSGISAVLPLAITLTAMSVLVTLISRRG